MTGRVLVIVAILLATHATAQPPTTPPPLQLQGRGVFFVDGTVRCPLGGIGARAPQASNRVALDDAYSTARVDPTAHRITLTNAHRYAHSQIVGDVLILAQGTTRQGEQVPVGVHLTITKRGNRFSTSLHPHPTTREPIVDATFEPYSVEVSDGRSERIVLTPEDIRHAIRDPSLTARLANLFVQVDDRLKDVPLIADAPDARLVDLDIGVGVQPINLKVARLTLRSLDPANAPLIARGDVREMLSRGAWEMRITSLTPFLPREEFDRDFFLLGIDTLPVLQPVIRDGLKNGQSLVVGYRDGQGFVGIDAATAPIAAPADVARAYMEFNFVGGLLAHQLARLPQRLPPASSLTPGIAAPGDRH